MSTPKLHFDRIVGTNVTRVPRRVLSVCVELLAASSQFRGHQGTLAMRLAAWSICDANRTQDGNWTRDYYEGITGPDHWSVLAELLRGRRSCWLVMPSVGEWLAATGGYAELTAGRLWIPGYTLPDRKAQPGEADGSAGRPGYVVLNGPTEIIVGRYRTTEVSCVAASNYGQGHLRELLPADIETIGPDRFRGRGRGVAEVLSDWYCGLIDTWREADAGIWAATAAGLSHGFYRRKYADGSLTLHRNHAAHRLERLCLYGGRAEVYQRGPQTGHFVRIDARSLYPSILATIPAPMGLEHCGSETSPKRLSDALRTHCVVAQVRISTPTDSYPWRLYSTQTTVLPSAEADPSRGTAAREEVNRVGRKRRTVYPTGEFVTTLCGPELRLALDRGHVSHVFGHAIYRTGKGFMGMAQECLSQRAQAADRGDVHGERFWKLIVNSFAGRLARRAGGWVSDVRVGNGEAWAEWFGPHPDTGVTVRCRSIGFVAQYYERETDEPKAFPVGFAWLTAWGRTRLAEIVASCGEEEVLCTDTDGLWCTRAGYERSLSVPHLWHGKPGSLRKVDEAQSVEFVTPKHYRIGDKWTMSGFADGFRILPNGDVVDYSRRSLYPADTADGPSCVLIDRRESSTAAMQDNHRWLGPYGRTRPWRLTFGDDTLRSDEVLDPNLSGE